MNASQALVTSALVGPGVTSSHSGATLTFYTGTMPATPETALSGNTALGAMTYSATAFAAPTYVSPDMQMTGNFTTASLMPSVNGTCTFARAVASNGTTVLADYTVGIAGSGADCIVGNTAFQTGVSVDVTQVLKMPAV